MTRVSDVADEPGPADGAEPDSLAGAEPGPSDSADRGPAGDVELSLTGSLAVAALAGAGLAITARVGATALLVAVAVVQALLAFAWLYATAAPGRRGALLIAGLAAAGSDVCVSVWPGSRLGTLLVVFALAVPVLFVHQLMRGAARMRIVESLGAVALLVLAETALPALLQLRHEFGHDLGGQVVSGVVVAAAGALVVGYVVDLLVPAPRFDPDVPRGLLAVVASAGLGGSVGYLMLQSGQLVDLRGGRGAFVGAASGALVALLAIGVAFVEHDTDQLATARVSGFGRRMRPVLGALLPLALLAPIAFLLCLAVRA
jgi:hypothetical protein